MIQPIIETLNKVIDNPNSCGYGFGVLVDLLGGNRKITIITVLYKNK